jgi:hypothetical protein
MADVFVSACLTVIVQTEQSWATVTRAGSVS